MCSAVGGCPEASPSVPIFPNFVLRPGQKPILRPPTALNTMFALSLERLAHWMGDIMHEDKADGRLLIEEILLIK